MFDILQFKEKPLVIFSPEVLVYLGLVLLGYAIPTSHTNAIESGGLIFVLLGCLGLKLSNRDFKLKDNPLYLPFGLFFAVILLSIPWSYNLGDSLNAIRGEFLTYTLLFFALSGFCHKREHLYRVMALLCLGNVFGVLLFAWHFYVVGFNQNQFAGLLAAKQIFNNGPVGASSYFIMFAAVCYAGLFFLPGKKNFFLISLLLALNLCSLYLSYQRAGIVAIGVVLFMPFVVWRMVAVKRLYLMLPVLLCLVVLFFLTPIRGKFQTNSWQVILSGDLATLDARDPLQVRVLIANHFWQPFKKHPFIGYGYGRSNLQKIDLESVKPRPGGLTHAHNSVFNFMLQTGVQGLVAFLLLLFMQIKICLKGIKCANNYGERFVFAGGLFLQIGFWVRMLFDDVYNSGTALMYWMVMAVIVGLFSILKAEQH